MTAPRCPARTRALPLAVLLAGGLVAGLAGPATAAPRDEPVVVAALVRADDGGYEVHRTTVPSREQGHRLAARLRTDDDVLDAEVDGLVRAAAVPAPDPLQSTQWGLSAVRAPGSWQHGDASGQVVAVVDSGVDLDHPDLVGALAPGWDVVDGDALADDVRGHGTHVAGIVAAVAGNGVGVAGTALRARVMPVRVLKADGTGSTADVAAGVLWAVDHGATVINLSLGGPTSSRMLTSAIEEALRRGVPVVAAAGNAGSAVPEYPAAQPGVVAVSAVSQDLRRPSWSNTGNHLALAAPGASVLSTADGGGWALMHGTSMAAPHVAGALAQLRALAPDAAPAELAATLMSTAADLGVPGRDTSFGAGLLDMAAAASALSAAHPAPATAPAPVPTAPATTDPAPATAPTTGALARGTDLACPVGVVPTAPFSDVGLTGPHAGPISCLVWWSVAQGRTATTYAPSTGVTREAMATFVARTVLAARPGSLPAAPPNAFHDDDASAHRLAIDQLAAVGVVGGTGGGAYSPGATVTRGQMARFLARAVEHVLGAPLPADRDVFRDDDGSTFEADIDRVALAGLTGGRSDGRYDAAGTVTREQMGSFLARTLDLLVSRGARLPG